MSTSANLREMLIEAALEILAEPETPLDLRKVAERAGKSRTAPYLVFGKESEGGGLLALRVAVAAEGARRLSERMESAALGVDDPVAGLSRVADAWLDYEEDNPRLFRLMFGSTFGISSHLNADEMRANIEVLELVHWRDRVASIVASLIDQAQRCGLLRRDPEPYRGSNQAPSGILPSQRYLEIAMTAMIGVARMRDDEILKVSGWNLERARGVRLVVEAVFGVDPLLLERVTGSFLRSRGAPELPGSIRTLRQFSGLRRAIQAEAELSQTRILWVSEDPDLIADHVSTLEQLGARITVVRSLDEPVGGEKQTLETPSLIIADVDVEKGSDTRLSATGLPVIYFTHSPAEEDAGPARSAPVTCDADELLHRIVDVIEGRSRLPLATR